MSQRQAKLIRKAFRTCPLLIAMYGRVDGKNYKAIRRPKNKLSVLAPDKRRVYQRAKGIIIALVILAFSLLPMSTGHMHQTRAQSPVDTLIPKIIKVESNGNPRAVSKKGAIGLMQVRWCVWKDELKKAGIAKHRGELLDPTVNVRAGKFVLTHYLKKHRGDVRKALHSYSGGAKGYYRKVMEVHNEEF
jgi:hypothetical protein